MYDVAVIGAGVTGCMTARVLSRYEVSVCVLERANDAAAGASRANSGIVHAGFDARPGSLKARLGVRGAALMARTAAELGVEYRQNGSLVLGFDQRDRNAIERLYWQGQENGVFGLQILDADQLHRLEPNAAARAVCALYAPTGAVVCPYGLTIAALGNAMDNGTAFFRGFAVVAMEETGVGMRIHARDGRWVEARYVVNAAGVYADRVAEMAGDSSFSIQPRRGEYLLLDKECGGLVQCTVFRTPAKLGKGILVSPTADGNLLLGPTAEGQESREDTGTTAKGLAEILGQAGAEVEQIRTGMAIASFAGLRAVGSTGDFIIRPWGRRMVHAAGIESPGLSAAPATAEYILDLLRTLGLETVQKTNYNPFRRSAHWIRDLPLAEKDEYIRTHPAYGKIVCRCEGVSEGEILETLERAPEALDLDGVKRRIRSGMGRCQGGFCTPRVTELIAEARKIPICQVTKSGGGSFIICRNTKGGGGE